MLTSFLKARRAGRVQLVGSPRTASIGCRYKTCQRDPSPTALPENPDHHWPGNRISGMLWNCKFEIPVVTAFNFWIARPCSFNNGLWYRQKSLPLSLAHHPIWTGIRAQRHRKWCPWRCTKRSGKQVAGGCPRIFRRCIALWSKNVLHISANFFKTLDPQCSLIVRRKHQKAGEVGATYFRHRFSTVHAFQRLRGFCIQGSFGLFESIKQGAIQMAEITTHQLLIIAPARSQNLLVGSSVANKHAYSNTIIMLYCFCFVFCVYIICILYVYIYIYIL